MLSGQREMEEHQAEDGEGRPQRNTRGQTNGQTSQYANNGSDEESEAASSWKGDDESNGNDFEGDDENEASEDESMLDVDESKPHSLVVHLHYGKTDQESGAAEGPPIDPSQKISGTDHVETQVVTNLSKDVSEKRTAEAERPTEATTKAPSEEKFSESSSSAPPHYEFYKENVSAHQGPKPEEINGKSAQELPIAPLEPSRVQNGNE